MFYLTLWHFVRLTDDFSIFKHMVWERCLGPAEVQSGPGATRWVIISYRSWQEFPECSDPPPPPAISHFSLKLVVLLPTKEKKVWNPHLSWNRGAHCFFRGPGLAWAVWEVTIQTQGSSWRQTLYTSRDQDRETTWDTPPIPPHSHVGCKDEV